MKMNWMLVTILTAGALWAGCGNPDMTEEELADLEAELATKIDGGIKTDGGIKPDGGIKTDGGFPVDGGRR